jgi:dipeptide/tripeptide permease
MFWQIFYSFPFYVTDVLKFEQFEILETVDAWTIILVTVPVTAMTKHLRPITAMTMGFVFASLSWFIIASAQSVPVTIAAIAFFAVGEAIQSPRFYEYVGSLAPKDQVGTFMGFAFLPVAIGSFTAGIVADWLRGNYLQTNPALMWYILGGIGFASTALMLLHNAYFVQKEQTQPT